ncbi:TonB-dependent receptor-like protein [Lysobacter ruishenii]|uniref:TonB-dependent receptor-like protein n=1 Tax=Aerolutibacter ruishenii TaxID=686800 RepID=A0A562LV42_9GAMM|nr:TonB-dependent receptor [Lysobacter ruishenii]TWI11519.1 TonB-dependent receptor-like protein [Lysobacter ruishenii]
MYMRNHLALAVAALLSAGVSTHALAQEGASAKADATNLDTVTVTGSHIKRAAISGVGPVTVIDTETIERSGAISVETLLQRMPASAGFAGNQTNAYWADNGYGTTQVNLRGLGINRTLVLLNGRRVVNGGTGANSSVDLNIIPVALIERIEVLKDGASAIYGADAVAGVVNIITKKNFEGAQASIRYGQTFEQDGEEGAADFAWGITGERGSIMAAINYAESGTVNMADRAPCGLGESDGQLVCVGSSSTIGGRAVLADGRRVNFNQTPGGDGNFYETYSSAKHNFNSNPYLNAVNPLKRISFSTFGNYALTGNVRAFTELMYTNRQSDQLATPGAIGLYRPIRISATHPTNPTGQNLTLQRRRLLEAGVREFYQEVDTFRAVLGLDGQIGDGWDWGVAVNWGRNTGIDGSTNVANLDRVDQTLNTAVCSNAPGAAIPCGDYLGYGDLTPAVLDYIMFTTRDNGGNDQKSFTANVSGQLFELPVGWVGMATGVEVRKERGWRDPDQLTVLGIANGNQQDPIAGEYTAKEAFVEVAVPLLQDSVMADSLTLNGAVRYSDYDLFGDDTNYKVGLDWQVVPSLKVRANYATAFRIPNVPELFGGVSEGNLTTTDPCNGWSSQPSSSTIYQNCQADGVPVGYTQLGNTVLTTVGGNQKLKPEDAETTTVGVVWTPAFADGLTLTLDYFNIKIDNAIQRIDGSTKLAVCYNRPGLAHQFCSADNFTRNALTGEIDFLSAQPVNAANERVSGVDLGALYQFGLVGWDSTLSWDVSYLKNYDVRPFDGADQIHYAGMITGGRGSFTHWRSFASLTMARGPWSGSYSVQYIGKADDINASAGDIGDHAPSLSYHNAQVKYAFGEVADVAFGIDNLWDKQAPFIQSWTDANTDTMTYDLLGRRWNVKLTYRW